MLAASALPPDEHSGAPHTTLGYAEALASRGCSVTVLYAVPRRGSWMCRAVRRAGESFDRVPVPRFVDDDADVLWSLTAASRRLDRVATDGFEHLLEIVAPDVFHVVNNTRLPLDLVELANRRGVPIVRTVTGTEDLCGLVTPVSPLSIRGVCAPPLSPRQCAQCVLAARPELATALGPADDRERAVEALLQRKRARIVQQFTHLVDAVVFPSAAFRASFERSLPVPSPPATVVEMGIDPTPWGGADVARQRAVRPRLHGTPVTFVAASSMSVAKGTTDVVAAFGSHALADRDDWRLHLVGGGDSGLGASLAGHPNVQVDGPFGPADLPGILGEADVGLAMSRAETFHRATREYLLGGLPVFGTPVGGIPEVVLDGVNGRLVPVARPDALVGAVLDVLAEPGRLDAMHAAACSTRVRTLAEEVDELIGIYRRVATATVA